MILMIFSVIIFVGCGKIPISELVNTSGGCVITSAGDWWEYTMTDGTKQKWKKEPESQQYTNEGMIDENGTITNSPAVMACQSYPSGRLPTKKEWTSLMGCFSIDADARDLSNRNDYTAGVTDRGFLEAQKVYPKLQWGDGNPYYWTSSSYSVSLNAAHVADLFVGQVSASDVSIALEVFCVQD